MHRLTVELIPDTELGGFTARVPDIPAYGEGVTEEEAIADLLGLWDALGIASSHVVGLGYGGSMGIEIGRAHV